MTLLSCNALNVAVGECVLVADLNIELQPGTITAVLGRNGTGKSLTLHTLAGLRPAAAGNVYLSKRDIHSYARRERAQRLGFVPQDIEEPFPVTVLECAVSGRHPHIDFWHWETEKDFAIARESLAAVDMHYFAEHSIETLSGGERRRLAIAAALTQQPQVFILDEPTNHLDPKHQLQMLKLLRHKADSGCAVIMSLHDPSLAESFADQALLLFGDGRWLRDSVSQALSATTLSELYHTPIQTIEVQGARRFFNT